jgi:hypothetical protein
MSKTLTFVRLSVLDIRSVDLIHFTFVIAMMMIIITYLVTYLLTYSMQQSPSWEANRFSASQEIPRNLRTPNSHYRIHKPVSVTTAWSVLRLQMEEKASSMEGICGSRGYSTRGDPPAWGLGEVLTTAHRKNWHSHEKYTPVSRTWTDSLVLTKKSG